MTTQQFNNFTPTQQYYFIKFITTMTNVLRLPHYNMDVYVTNTMQLPDAPEFVYITAQLPYWPPNLDIRHFMYEYDSFGKGEYED